MSTPFPGMDPWLEQPGIWNDLHTRLMTAFADDLAERLYPHYYVTIDQRAYIAPSDEDTKMIGSPDVSVVNSTFLAPLPPQGTVSPVLAAEPVEVEVTLNYEEVTEHYLEVRKPKSGQVITVIELLSPKNKKSGEGRVSYLRKRLEIIRSQSHLVEIDLLRGGQPMNFAWRGKSVPSDYRILISRTSDRPSAELYPFTIREPIPRFKMPLLPNDKEPLIDMTTLLHHIYKRAHYEMMVDYTTPPTPRLKGENAAWVDQLLKARGLR